MFIILNGYKCIDNWKDAFDNLSMDVNPQKCSFIFPIADKHGTLRFASTKLHGMCLWNYICGLIGI